MRSVQSAIVQLQEQLATQDLNLRQLTLDNASVIATLHALGRPGDNTKPRSRVGIGHSGESRIMHAANGLLKILQIIAISGWKRYFRSWRIVAPGDPTWFALHGGDLVRLQRLIMSNQATIHDRK